METLSEDDFGVTEYVWTCKSCGELNFIEYIPPTGTALTCIMCEEKNVVKTGEPY